MKEWMEVRRARVQRCSLSLRTRTSLSLLLFAKPPLLTLHACTFVTDPQVSGMTITRGPMNIFTIISFAFGWIKFNIIPEPIRFAWYLVWVQLRIVLRKAERHVVLAGARVDAALTRVRSTDMHARRMTPYSVFHTADL